MNVSIEDLAASSGLVEGKEGSIQVLRMQIGVVQAMPRTAQYAIYHEFAAKYLSALVEKYRASKGPLEVSAVMLNSITFTPYFVRFSHTAAGAGLAALQAKLTLDTQDTFNPRTKDVIDMAEFGQFFSTLLVLQGLEGIDVGDRKKLFKQILQWVQTMPNGFAVDTCERCLMALEDVPDTRQMMAGVRANLEKSLKECGASRCTRKAQSDGTAMLQCSR